jgi:hypothetical protein
MSDLKLVDGPLAESFAVVFFFCMDIRPLLMTKLEHFIGSFVTVSGRRAVVGGFFVTDIVFCCFEVCVSELEVSWIFCTPKSSLCIIIFFHNFQYICNVWFQ